MKRKYVIILIFCLPILIPLFSFILWSIKENKPLKVLIYDMTVPHNSYDEHNSLSWVLIHQKYTSFNQLNRPDVDYKGFFPLKDFKFVTKDFLSFTNEEVFQVADSLDMVYYTDTYGIYSNEWYGDTLHNERSPKIYGGLNKNDLVLLRRLKESNKLILAEFNFLASPTSHALRIEAENLFDVKWTGWVGRYYDPLDTLINPDIPMWAKRQYKRQYGKSWDFHQPGILFVHEKDKIVVLEMENTLTEEVPWIYTSEYGKQKYGLPLEITYPYWFDIMQSGESNRVVSKYKIYTNASGKKLLSENGIPDVFPCVIENREKNYYYFAGDFCDNTIYIESAKFLGVPFLHKLFYDRYNYIDRTPFFWHFFRPMVTSILDDYYNQLVNTKGRPVLPAKTSDKHQNLQVNSNNPLAESATYQVKYGEQQVSTKNQPTVQTAIPDHALVTPVISTPNVSRSEKSVVLSSDNKASGGPFYLIGGSFKVRENAEKLLAKLIKQGHNARMSKIGDVFFRVSVDCYQTRKEAEQAMIKLLESDPKTSYWLMVEKK